MVSLQGLAWLLLMQVAGELLSRGFGLPFPGPVVGMLLLIVALRLPQVRTPVAQCAEALLAHLSLLFIPVGVGVMTHLGLFETYGGRMILVVALSTWIGMAATVAVLQRLWPSPPSVDKPMALSVAARPADADAAGPAHPERTDG